MAGTKRGAEDAPATRASKVAKKDGGATPSKGKKGGKKAAKAIPTSAFLGKALPLHMNLTHTPPSIADAESVPAAGEDPGHLGSVTLVAAAFSTGSYGWKGNKRLTIELMNAEGGTKEKVTVMLTINATVVGSKGAKEGEGEEKEKKEKEGDEEEAAEEEGEGADDE
ncbi:hypothetical protein B0H15DRAFT_835964 [Mycena belliarum]|uniref:Uncharacterized protein n=1 Tax=Mycena belliarum TaxID=1033014 RepID=A0AAD6XNH9_9AGAR|nr:hypothetical protein B0H15DRAFT_835964 [Mycena belliae]